MSRVNQRGDEDANIGLELSEMKRGIIVENQGVKRKRQ